MPKGETLDQYLQELSERQVVDQTLRTHGGVTGTITRRS
jgi:hypothetical protein